MLKNISIFFVFLSSVTVPYLVLAQEDKIELANEYKRRNECDKANEIYKDLAKKETFFTRIFNEYAECLQAVNDQKGYEKLIEKAAEDFPLNIVYRVKYLNYIFDQNKKKEKEIERLKNDFMLKPDLMANLVDAVIDDKHYDEALELIESSRQAIGSLGAYPLKVSKIYFYKNQSEQGFEEVLKNLGPNENDKVIEQTTNFLSNYITDQENTLLFKKLLLKGLKKNSDYITYNKLLLWVYLQEKNFDAAFIQAKALDLRLRNRGENMLEVAQLARENREWNSADEFFNKIIDIYNGQPFVAYVKRLEMENQEEWVRNTYPVNKQKVNGLIMDYDRFNKENPKNFRTVFQNKRNIALLYGELLNRTDTAILLLQEVVSSPYMPTNYKDESKLYLGDFYVIDEQPWEASLIYSQIEKSQNDSYIGHQAKLRNARLSYFRGDFELARDHLNVLKMATTREIANDALDLSLLISDNTALDSNFDAMKFYARIEHDIFMNRYENGIEKIATFKNLFPGHSLQDELFFLEAQLFEKTGMFDKAIASYKTVAETFGNDLYGDDALFKIAQIYDIYKKNDSLAQVYYEKILLNHKNSVFVSESRKRYRILRGEAHLYEINKEDYE